VGVGIEADTGGALVVVGIEVDTGGALVVAGMAVTAAMAGAEATAVGDGDGAV